MSCECPVCGRETEHVGTLFSHILNTHNPTHREWLDDYCVKNNINMMRLLAERALDKKNANKPLTDAFRRDFCDDC